MWCSRKYSGMKLANLSGAGDAVKELETSPLVPETGQLLVTDVRLAIYVILTSYLRLLAGPQCAHGLCVLLALLHFRAGLGHGLREVLYCLCANPSGKQLLILLPHLVVPAAANCGEQEATVRRQIGIGTWNQRLQVSAAAGIATAKADGAEPQVPDFRPSWSSVYGQGSKLVSVPEAASSSISNNKSSRQMSAAETTTGKSRIRLSRQ